MKIGDTVRFLNEVGGGKIVNLLPAGKILVESDDGFDYEYDPSELVLVTANDTHLQDISTKDLNRICGDQRLEHHNEQVNKKLGRLKKTERSSTFEVDLHVENLIDSHHGMGNFQIVQVQMTRFRRALREAKNRRLDKMIVIHGVGSGVLREEIWAEIKECHPDYVCQDASFDKYGYGATEILLR